MYWILWALKRSKFELWDSMRQLFEKVAAAITQPPCGSLSTILLLTEELVFEIRPDMGVSKLITECFLVYKKSKPPSLGVSKCTCGIEIANIANIGVEYVLRQLARTLRQCAIFAALVAATCGSAAAACGNIGTFTVPLFDILILIPIKCTLTEDIGGVRGETAKFMAESAFGLKETDARLHAHAEGGAGKSRGLVESGRRLAERKQRAPGGRGFEVDPPQTCDGLSRMYLEYLGDKNRSRQKQEDKNGSNRAAVEEKTDMHTQGGQSCAPPGSVPAEGGVTRIATQKSLSWTEVRVGPATGKHGAAEVLETAEKWSYNAAAQHLRFWDLRTTIVKRKPPRLPIHQRAVLGWTAVAAPISQTCQDWRNIALGYPALWDDVRIPRGASFNHERTVLDSLLARVHKMYAFLPRRALGAFNAIMGRQPLPRLVQLHVLRLGGGEPREMKCRSAPLLAAMHVQHAFCDLRGHEGSALRAVRLVEVPYLNIPPSLMQAHLAPLLQPNPLPNDKFDLPHTRRSPRLENVPPALLHLARNAPTNSLGGCQAQ
ncbi:hypothetical protein C8J57DRAFT_1617927 [Mycena rebaudengoi]|nr:hypothetical protein C8J57DRAFT_1617927 [Mycena rebaudengoi]